ncbi:MAG: Fic family protein [Deltaproteobacteria bacterium]|jgi:Fic family protein/predicted transcriptional regulator|nr:Fic family protein [Deltaproteobacteria bacterium]
MTQQPPYTLTLGAADYLAKIIETVMSLELGTGFKRNLELHRKNRAQSIFSSLAIAGSTLSLEQVTAVIEGQLVNGEPRQIKEVQNAYEAYEKLMTFDPNDVQDFLQAHQLMMDGLVKESGQFRSGEAADRRGELPQFVSQLIEELLRWAKKTTLHPVLKSAVLLYEIETIHPFADGNGRLGRLWQTLTLAKWKSLFEWLPMEAFFYDNKPQYYQAIEEARQVNDGGVFIEFTLAAIFDTIKTQEQHQEEHDVEHNEKHQVNHEDKPNNKHQDNHKVRHKDRPQETHQDRHEDRPQVNHQETHQVRHEDRPQVELSDTHFEILRITKAGSLSRKEIFASIGLSGDTRSFNRNIGPLLSSGLIEMTVPDKPNSKFQRYRLTAKGKAAAKKA